MEVNSHQKGKVNQLLIVFVGLIILVGSIFTYLFILRGVYGKFQTASLFPDSKLVHKVIYGGDNRIAVLYSKYTENMLEEGNTWLNDNITTWEKFLGGGKYSYDIIDDQTIEKGKHFGYDILVLPGSKSLSDLEIMQIKKFIINGGSVFATSGIASFSDNGKWRGWEFFSEVFGLRFTKEIDTKEQTKIHTIRGGLAITANIPTGFPFKVATWDRPMSVEVLDPRTTQVSFWYNYRMEEGLTREEVKKSAGIAYGTYGKGRFVWMGFEINSVIGVQEDYIYFDRLFKNSVNWLSYGPIAFVKEWPTGYDAAAVIAPTITRETDNLSNLLNVLKNEKVPATFFIDPATAEQNKNIVQGLNRYGEIGALLDLGYLSSVNDTINKLNDLNTQSEKLKNAKTVLEEITKSQVTGCLPYYGLFDQNTISALSDARYKYVFTDSLTDRSVPKVIFNGDNKILSMTKTARDDYEVIRDFNLTQPEFQFYTYQEDIDRVLFEGGMYVLKVHPEYQCKPENVNIVKQVIQDLKRKKYWITTASEIQNWCAKKSSMEIRVDRRGDSRISITISNPGSQLINGVVVQVDLNENAEKVSLSTEIIGTRLARYIHEKGSKTINLYIDDLKSNESRTYYIDYDRPKA